MDAIHGIVRDGRIELLAPIPAEDETPALVFVFPKTTNDFEEGKKQLTLLAKISIFYNVCESGEIGRRARFRI